MDDVLVVGAGLGGLVAGALLANRGFKVAVVERHYVAGGCATTFHRKAFKYEVSLHALDGLDAGDPKLPLFGELGILEHVPFVHVPRAEFFRFRHPDLDVTIPADFEAAARVLGNAFPRERKRLHEFFRTLADIRAGLAGIFLADGLERHLRLAGVPFRHPRLLRYWNTSIGEYLDQLFDDELLKLALVSNLLYYNDDPRRLSLFWYSLAQGSFFAGGVHFVKGGSQVLSDYLAHFIRRRGGEVLLGQTVEEILTERGRAVGARYRKTLGTSRPERVRYARTVIVNAPLPAVVNEMIRAPEIASYRERVNSLEKSCSFLSLFLGFDRPPASLGNTAYSTLLAGDDVSKPDDLVLEFRGKDWSRKGFEFVDYSQVDHGLAASGKSVGVISLVDYTSNWDLPEQEYRQQKAYVTDVLLNRLERALPGARSALEHCEMATPRSIERFTGNPDGCIYGFQQTVRQAVPFRLDHSSPIRDLYFASAWVTPGGGYSGAMLAGMSCARAVAHALCGKSAQAGFTRARISARRENLRIA
jgi:phytoene dehydrogenase-like protein